VLSGFGSFFASQVLPERPLGFLFLAPAPI
jgi:hypothetical protein